MPPPPSLFLALGISFHISILTMTSQSLVVSLGEVCLKEIRDVSHSGYSGSNGTKGSCPKPGLCLCFTNYIQQDPNCVKRKPSVLAPLAGSREGCSGLSYFPHHKDAAKRAAGAAATTGIQSRGPECQWLEMPFKQLFLRHKDTL